MEVRRVAHQLRATASEDFNSQFTGLVDVRGAVPAKGLATTRRFALGAVFVYQLTPRYRHERALAPRVGLDPLRKTA